MKAHIPQPVHESYLKHRKQLVWQIIFPVALSVLLLVALIVLIGFATFRDNGDVARWAAISTMWIAIPVMVGLLVVLALLLGIIYLLKKLLNITPTYTSLAQHYVYKAESIIKRALDAVVNRVIELQGTLATVGEFFKRIKL